MRGSIIRAGAGVGIILLMAGTAAQLGERVLGECIWGPMVITATTIRNHDVDASH
jgi:hypothetical protein